LELRTLTRKCTQAVFFFSFGCYFVKVFICWPLLQDGGGGGREGGRWVMGDARGKSFYIYITIQVGRF
jgi:hypothetical protein